MFNVRPKLGDADVVVCFVVPRLGENAFVVRFAVPNLGELIGAFSRAWVHSQITFRRQVCILAATDSPG